MAQDIKDVKKPNGKFRFANQYVLLTYKTHLDKKAIAEFFQKEFGYKQIEIAHENGKEDKETPYEHTHIFINFGKRIQSTNTRVFDFNELHPHIEPVRKKSEIPKVLNYLSKEDPECKHLAMEKNKAPTLASMIWQSETIHDALMHCQKPGDAPGIIALYNNRPREEEKDELKLNGWQEELFQIISGKPDDRKVIWIYDKMGGIGKSRMARWMMNNKLAYVIKQFGGEYHASTTIKEAIESGWDKKVLIADLTRSNADKDIYSPIEAIKDGMMTSVKYGGKTICFDPPHVVIFANFLPDVKKLSMDRWDIWDITKSADGLYNISRPSAYTLNENKEDEKKQ